MARPLGGSAQEPGEDALAGGDGVAGSPPVVHLIDRRGRFPDHPGPRITSLDELPGLLGISEQDTVVA